MSIYELCSGNYALPFQTRSSKYRFKVDDEDTRENSRDFVLVFLLLTSIPFKSLEEESELKKSQQRPFHVTGFFLYSLRTSENQGSSDVCREYRTIPAS